MLPTIVHEHAVRPFSFYAEGQVTQGMSYKKKLYKLVQSFTVEQRVLAFRLGCHLSTGSCPAVLTISPHTCRVWMEIRSPLQPDPAESNHRTGQSVHDQLPQQTLERVNQLHSL